MRRPMTSARTERGGVAVITALTIVALVGFAGLALDLARMFVHKTELQNAVDACALAASRELNVPVRTLAVLTRAENAGITVAARNLSNFQASPVRLIESRDVTFSNSMDPATYLIKESAPSDSKYARCTVRVSGIVPWFIQVLGIDALDVPATAVATMSPSVASCTMPLGMCAQTSPSPCAVAGVTPDANGLCRGQWYFGLNDSPAPAGNFGWLQFPGSKGGTSTLASQIERCQMMFSLGDQAEMHSDPGWKGGAAPSWNSYFGLYKNSGLQPADSAPDYSGYAYTALNCPNALVDGKCHDVAADFRARRDSNTSYGPTLHTTKEGNDLTGLSVQTSFKASTPAVHAAGADRRVVAMPLVDCSGWGSGQTNHLTTVSGWACALMVQPIDSPSVPVPVEYLGIPGEADVPCGTYGHAGGNGPKVPTLVQ